jgi:hypothetical protein
MITKEANSMDPIKSEGPKGARGAIGKPPREMMMLENWEEEIENEDETENTDWGTDEKNPWRYLDGWEALANAIILQAAEDYREARTLLHTNSRLRKPRSVIKEVEQFFHSDWFTWLTSLDGEMLLERLKKETIV